MTNSQLFSQAHTMTKQIIKQGDCYKTTFGLCLKAIKSQQASQQVVKNNTMIFFVIIFVMFINKASNILKDLIDIELVIFFVAIFLNPFSLLIYSGLYLSITGS